jgi:hypothetical protein
VTAEVLSQQWGQAEGVAVVGNVAYTVIGPRLVALDVADPTAPVMLGQSQILPGPAVAVVVESGVAYVAAGSVVVALDVADPTSSLAVLSQVDVGLSVTQLGLAGNKLVAGISVPWANPAENGSGGIVTLDVSMPGRPLFLDYEPLPSPVYTMASYQSMVYAAYLASTDFYALDISDPAHLPAPIIIPSAALTYSLRAVGHVLVAGGGVSDLHAWDVSDPLQPQPLWDVQAPPDAELGLGVVEGFILRDQHAFLATVGYDGQTAAIVPLDLPKPMTAPAGMMSGRLAFVDDRAFFARGDLLIYNLATSADAIEVGRYDWLAINDVALLGNTGIVLADNRLLTVNLPDLTALGEYVGQTHCAPCYAAYQDVALANDVAYVSAADDGLRIISLTDPRAPMLLGSLDATTGYAALHVGSVAAGQLVYLADAGVCDGPNLMAFDLADPATPRLIDELSIEGCVAALDVDGGRLYAAGNFADRPGGALTVLTERAVGPQPTGSLVWPEPVSSVHGFGDFALVGTAAGLEVVSVADPTAPEAVASLPIPGGVHDIAVAGSLAMVTIAGSEGKLIAIDLRQPSRPQQVGETNLPAAGMRLAATDGHVLVGNPAAGIVLLGVSER